VSDRPPRFRGRFFRRACGHLTLFTSPPHGDSVAILAPVVSYDERMIDAAGGLDIDRAPDVTLSRCVMTV
jgi:hypothetical protein